MASRTDSKTLPLTSEADLIFVSSDGVRYGLHSKNLEINTGGFPPVTARGLSVSDPVALVEPSSVLDLLFPFIYPMEHPHIEDLEFQKVIQLAEAAEKYQVYPAMFASRMCLRYSGNFIEKYPIEIALFAAKHEYAELLKLTAGHAVKLPLSTVVPLLPERLVLPWIKFREAHMSVNRILPGLVGRCFHGTRREYGEDRASFKKPEDEISVGYPHCDTWRSISQLLLTNYSERGPFCSSDVDAIVDSSVPTRASSSINGVPKKGCCAQALNSIKTELKVGFKDLTPFSDFMRCAY